MLNRQALAALRAPALEHRPAVLRRHSRAKAVLFGASAIVRLKCSLRHNRSPSVSPESENLEFTKIGWCCQSYCTLSSGLSCGVTLLPLEARIRFVIR